MKFRIERRTFQLVVCQALFQRHIFVDYIKYSLKDLKLCGIFVDYIKYSLKALKLCGLGLIVVRSPHLQESQDLASQLCW